MRRLAFWSVTALGLLLTFIGIFGYQTIKGWLRSVLAKRIDEIVGGAVHESLPRMLKEAQSRAESHVLKTAEILALRTYGAYDEALAEYRWDGSVARLRDKSPIERRAIIECLYSAKRSRADNRIAAWKAIEELLEDDKSVETLRLFLRLAVTCRHYPDGLAFIEKNWDLVGADRDCALRASTLLRKLGRHHEALQISLPLLHSGDLTARVSVAALQRDLGRLDDVHDLLLPDVTRLLATPPPDLPEGWFRLVNTYVANCIDRGRPGDAVGAAAFELRHSHGSVEVHTAGRLIMALPSSDPHRAELLSTFRSSVDNLLPSEEATTRCRVILHRLDAEPAKALSLLAEAIAATPVEPGHPMPSDIYFHRCNLAQMLVEMGRPGDAIDELMPAAEHKYGGEAKFLLAVAHAAQGQGAEAARWLRRAIEELPKWAVHARDHLALRAVPEIQNELSKHAAEQGRALAVTP
ncbi:MAG: hypothetical protein HY825_08430 [Acidobacteria bacterium]|nr:hypothetical protein [Acidobacteriota bacterium]